MLSLRESDTSENRGSNRRLIGSVGLDGKPLLSKLAGITVRNRWEIRHSLRLGGRLRVEVGVLLSKLGHQESGICWAASASRGGG